ncbi:MAG: hypothetical protein QM664_13720 [Flavihumibacter sp.]
MKKLIIVLCFIISAGIAVAQEPGGGHKTPEERAKAQSEKMKSELKLTDDQYTKIYDLNLKYAKKSDEIRSGSNDRTAKMKAVTDAMDEKDKEIKGILDAGQYEKYEAMKAEQKEKMKEHRRQ